MRSRYCVRRRRRRLSVRNVLWLNGASWSKSYCDRKSYIEIEWCQNDLDLCLEVVQAFKVMPIIAASIAPKLLELETSNLMHGFVWGMPSGRTSNFSLKVGVA